MFSRALSLLLLGFIVYGTTVEAAHTHGSLAAANNTIASSSFSDQETGTKANSYLLGCGDCLICQLHQQFSATLVSVSPSIAPPRLKSHFFSLPDVSIRSEAGAAQRGRAPPFTSYSLLPAS